MDTPLGHDRNADQIAYWNGPAGGAGHPAAAGSRCPDRPRQTCTKVPVKSDATDEAGGGLTAH